MYDVGDELLNGIKHMYVNSLDCVRVKGDESECFRTDNVVRQGCIMSSWLFDVYMDAVMREVKMEIGRMGLRFLEEGSEWRLPRILYTDDLILCSKSEKDMKVTVGH